MSFRRVRLIALLCVLSPIPVLAANQKPTHPVILIPGVLGSKLCDSKGDVLWGDNAWDSLTKFAELELPLEGKTSIAPCKNGIVTKVQVLGPLYSVGAYSGLLAEMKNWGLEQGKKNLFIFTYDWRLSNVDNANVFKKFVEDNLGGKKFNIVAHSMGGIVARLYIEDIRNRSNVNKVIYLGTPFLGSMNTLGTLSEGWSDAVGFQNWMAGGVETIRKVMLSFPSFLELLPRYRLRDEVKGSRTCCEVKTLAGKYNDIDVFSSTAWKSLSWLPNAQLEQKYFARFGENLKRAASLSTILANKLPDVAEVRFAGDPKPTRTTLAMYETNTAPDANNWKFISDAGDGVVPAWSAAQNLNKQSGILEPTLSGSLQSFAEHSTIFDDDWVRAELKRELFTAEPITKREIAGSGHPEIRLSVEGFSRSAQIINVKLLPRSTYLGQDDGIGAQVDIKLDDGSGTWLRPGLYRPSAHLKQDEKIADLEVLEVGSDDDARQSVLRFELKGATEGFQVGALEIILSLPSSSVHEYVVLSGQR